jgi:hypothetical protein
VLHGVPIEMCLPEVEEERQSEGDTDGKDGDHRQPETPHAQAPAFLAGKNTEHDCRDQHVYTEERSDTVREKIAGKSRKIQAVLQQPGHELRVRQN